jgi:hypothetical protein
MMRLVDFLIVPPILLLDICIEWFISSRKSKEGIYTTLFGEFGP